jgi:hypothetical protein
MIPPSNFAIENVGSEDSVGILSQQASEKRGSTASRLVRITIQSAAGHPILVGGICDYR